MLAVGSLARAVVEAPKTCHITLILRSLHWLKITKRIEYKLLPLTYKVFTTTQPSYLHNLISIQLAHSTRSSAPVTLTCPPTSSTLLTLVHAFVVTKVDYCSSVLSGVSGQLLQRLQSVFNAAARLVFSARKSEHITPLLRELHWLKVPERIQFRLYVLVYRCLNGMAPSYLAETLHLTADVGSRRRLRSASTSTLVIPSTRRTTLGDRAFPVAAARAWNALPASLRCTPSLLQFRRDLKTELFCSSFL